MAWTVPWNLLGLTVSGDVGGITIYTDRFGRKVAFPKSPPEKPPSAAQSHQRTRFTQAQAAWAALSAQEKACLEDAALKGGMVATGQNLYIKVALTNDTPALDTLAQQTGTILPPVPFIA